MIKVGVSGAAGKMGQAVCRAVLKEEGLRLVGAADPSAANKKVGEVVAQSCDVTIAGSLQQMLVDNRPDVLVDFTNPGVVMENIRQALEHNVHLVVGTTGIGEKELNLIKGWLKDSAANVFIAPNFAIGAILMMHTAKIASRYMPNYEIIEMHHDQKADAPSGTSIATAQKLEGIGSAKALEEAIRGARGAKNSGTRIHSVRLPGLVAHQEVIFGAEGQTLTIRHDSIDRTSFMPGVVLAIKKVSSLSGLTVGLENLLGL